MYLQGRDIPEGLAAFGKPVQIGLVPGLGGKVPGTEMGEYRIPAGGKNKMKEFLGQLGFPVDHRPHKIFGQVVVRPLGPGGEYADGII